jgi:hypothetical protein
MKTLSITDLETVTGGKLQPTTSISGGGDNDQILSTLQGIQSSLKDLGKTNNGLFGGNSGLLFMTMALAMGRRSEVSVNGGACCGRRGFRWRVW